jgi:GH35 family endo-1,4-beta-xylanase
VNEPIHSIPYADMSRLEYSLDSLVLANASNPDAQLSVNEFGILGHDFGYGPYYEYIGNLIALNAPFDVIGLQGREPRHDWIPATEVWQSINAYASFGKDIHITEFFSLSAPVPITNSWRKGLWSEANQAEYATRFYKLIFSHPACESIVWWGLTDSRSWVEGCGLLREDMSPKPVYTALDQLINHEWRTVSSAISNTSGWIDFQGYYGVYNVSIQNGAYTFQINLNSQANNYFILEI